MPPKAGVVGSSASFLLSSQKTSTPSWELKEVAWQPQELRAAEVRGAECRTVGVFARSLARTPRASHPPA
jgi:hypothetical protein